MTKTRIITKRLEHLFFRKKVECLNVVRKYHLWRVKGDQKKAEVLDRLNRLINRKNEVYSVFYTMKFNKNDLGSR